VLQLERVPTAWNNVIEVAEKEEGKEKEKETVSKYLCNLRVTIGKRKLRYQSEYSAPT
jgi:hypothetical protein